MRDLKGEHASSTPPSLKMSSCLSQLDVSFAPCDGLTRLGLCRIIGSGLRIRIIRPRLSIGIIGSGLRIRIIRPRRHSRWCSSKAKRDIISPALTQDAESLLRITNRFDKHDAAACIKFTLIVVGILFRDTYSHPVISRVCRGSCLARKQTFEALDKTVCSMFY